MASKISGRFMFYFITIKTRFNIKIFIRDGYFNIIKDSIEFCNKNYNLKTNAYVLMPDHIHWLFSITDKKQISFREGFSNPSHKINQYRNGLENPFLKDMIKNFKGYTAKTVIKSMKATHDKNLEYLLLKRQKKNCHYYSLWQKKYHVRYFKSKNELINKINYTKQNPIKENLPINYQYIYVNH